jgi:CRISPR-associated exonuclease Cas4
MIEFFLALTGLIFLIGLIFLWFINKKEKSYGSLMGDRVYSDSDKNPGKVLYSQVLPLIGKPDYIIKEGNTYIPVEVKTGKTPSEPYESHTMQLMAYCFLIEENYNITPPGGYIKYPDKEFKIAYTQEAKKSLKYLVKEVMIVKESREELHCKHKNHYESTHNLY